MYCIQAASAFVSQDLAGRSQLEAETHILVVFLSHDGFCQNVVSSGIGWGRLRCTALARYLRPDIVIHQ